MDELNRAILVTVTRTHSGEIVEEHLDELAFLAETLGIESAGKVVQNLPHPDPRTYVGKGKFMELKNEVIKRKINHVIFDDDLSPSQLRNIERELNPADQEEKVRVYDRSLLILDIFMRRAKTAQAKTQVELARNQYLLPRLTRLWTHLERQRGGTGTRGGAGEKEIETDRRNIRYQISVLEDKLERIERQKQTQRKSRENIVRVALVGYTNVGKSTLMNLLSGSGVLAEDKLFATVDSTVRKVVLGNIPFLLSDTVGFIRKLPHHLVESFKSTLDEVREADILLHVVDIAHPFHDSQIDVVGKTLTEIGAGDKNTILVLNKIDKLEKDAEVNYDEMKGYYREHGFDNIVFVSAASGENIDQLKEILFQEVKKRHLSIYPNYLKNGYEYPYVPEQSLD
jgi:GTP-binding protein HflX